MTAVRFGKTHFIPIQDEKTRIRVLTQLAILHLSKETKKSINPDNLADEDILVIDTRPDKPVKIRVIEAPILAVKEDDVEIQVFSNTPNPTYQMSPTEDDAKIGQAFSGIHGYTTDHRSSLNSKQLFEVIQYLKEKYLSKKQ